MPGWFWSGCATPGLGDLAQGLMDTIFVGFDEGLRDLGTGDMGMGRRMKKIADAFYGRMRPMMRAAMRPR